MPYASGVATIPPGKTRQAPGFDPAIGTLVLFTDITTGLWSISKVQDRDVGRTAADIFYQIDGKWFSGAQLIFWTPVP